MNAELPLLRMGNTTQSVYPRIAPSYDEATYLIDPVYR